MRLTEVEAIVLRDPDGSERTIADGSQDVLLIRLGTDHGIVGYGDVDSSPSVVKAIVDAPGSHKFASGRASLLIGEDPLAPERLGRRLIEGSLYTGVGAR